MSQPLELLAPAKINLFLELKSKRPDGFHELETVMSCVSLYDQLRFVPTQNGQIILEQAGASEGMPDPEQNLVVKALRLLQTHTGSSMGMKVRLTKRIPVQAGLGGASSDAATALLAGNRLWNTRLDTSAVSALAAQLGSDIPFFVTGGTALCLGRGERVTTLPGCKSYSVLIVRPPVGLSTPDVFSHCEIPSQPRSSRDLIDAIQSGNNNAIQASIVNRLEPAASQLTGWIERIRNAFDGLQSTAHQLSGSGSCYFGLFSNRKLLRNAASRLLQREPKLALYCGSLIGRLAHHFPDFCIGKNLTSPHGME